MEALEEMEGEQGSFQDGFDESETEDEQGSFQVGYGEVGCKRKCPLGYRCASDSNGEKFCMENIKYGFDESRRLRRGGGRCHYNSDCNTFFDYCHYVRGTNWIEEGGWCRPRKGCCHSPFGCSC
jgi:hypothetical protein